MLQRKEIVVFLEKGYNGYTVKKKGMKKMKQAIKITEAKIAELEAIIYLAEKLWTNSDSVELRDEFLLIIGSPKMAVFIARYDENIIGFAYCSLRVDYVEGTTTSPVGYLEGIYILEAYRQQGIAKNLVDYCIVWSQNQECDEFASDCELENLSSSAFHQKLGFKEVGKTIHFARKI